MNEAVPALCRCGLFVWRGIYMGLWCRDIIHSRQFVVILCLFKRGRAVVTAFHPVLGRSTNYLIRIELIYILCCNLKKTKAFRAAFCS